MRPVKDLSGQKFNRWTVIDRACDRFSGSGKRRVYWNCQCECGTFREVRHDALTSHKSCGCLRDEVAKENVKKAQAAGHKNTPEDLTGNRVGILTVKEQSDYSYTKSGRALVRWLCECDCGTMTNILGDSLRKGLVSSCGCILKGALDSGCSSNNEYFIKRATEVHKNKYDYSKTVYLHSKEKVTVICPDHGEFSIIPGNHLNGGGCKECFFEGRRKPKEQRVKKVRKPVVGKTGRVNYKHSPEAFAERSAKQHEGKYDYSKVVYENCYTLVEIVCPAHGSFWQKPQVHWNGAGCQECSIEARSEKQHWNYLERCRLNPEMGNAEGHIYLLEMDYKGERFFKLGISSNYKKRIARYSEEGISFNILECMSFTNLKCGIIERDILKRIKLEGLKYLPKVAFKGYTECAILEAKDFILNAMREKSSCQK